MARACVLLLLVSAYCAWAFVPPPPRRLAAPAVQVRLHASAQAFIASLCCPTDVDGVPDLYPPIRRLPFKPAPLMRSSPKS